MALKIIAHINVDANVKKLDNPMFWTFVASEWHRLYSPFVPMQTGNLMEDVTVKPKAIIHNAPYACRWYEVNANFRKDKHPMASSKWDKAAEPTQKPKLIKSAQVYIDSGRLGL